ncbi:MAG TPA: hypothetical protein VMV56_07680 [Williamwhitmania sp.]|nr:hypothetical protein [Williamwhitmania sp.]
MNSITFWLPRLQNVGFPVPKTIMINADVDLCHIIDEGIIKEDNRFFDELDRAIDILGVPVFLRTEMLSNKWDWKESCFLENKKNIISHVANLFEASALANIDRFTDCNFFAIREFIETEKVFIYFNDMPITKEIRVFIKNGKILCQHPYWPDEAFENINSDLIKKVQILDKKDKEIINRMGVYLSNVFHGWWSVDFLKSKHTGWYVTDMAIGENSWHFDNCSNNLLKNNPLT